MSAYIITSIDVHDPETYATYREKARAVLRSFRIRSHILSPLEEPPVVLEGEAPGHLVVMEFDSMEEIDRFYNSPEYQEAVPYRQASATTHYVIAVNGKEA